MVKFINVQIERLYLLLLPGVNVLKLDFTQLTKNKMFTINLSVPVNYMYIWVVF